MMVVVVDVFVVVKEVVGVVVVVEGLFWVLLVQRTSLLLCS